MEVRGQRSHGLSDGGRHNLHTARLASTGAAGEEQRGGVGLVQGAVDSSGHPRGRDLSVMGYVGMQLRAGVWTRDLLVLKLLRRDGISLVVQWLRVNLLMQGV